MQNMTVCVSNYLSCLTPSYVSREATQKISVQAQVARNMKDFTKVVKRTSRYVNQIKLQPIKMKISHAALQFWNATEPSIFRLISIAWNAQKDSCKFGCLVIFFLLKKSILTNKIITSIPTYNIQVLGWRDVSLSSREILPYRNL